VKNFNIVAKLPEVIGAALSDASGSLLDCAGQMDGEMAGAVHAFTARSLAQAGEILGLSALERVTLTGGKSACVIAVHDNHVLGVDVDPSKPLAAIEKKIWDTVTK
jgi:hypothetical protein